MNMLDLNVTHVDRVYVGKAHKCFCGCAGTYDDLATKPARVVNVFKKVMGCPDAVFLDGLDGGIATTTIGSKTYAVYFKAAA